MGIVGVLVVGCCSRFVMAVVAGVVLAVVMVLVGRRGSGGDGSSGGCWRK